jgi:hypothetical protein
MSEDTNAFSKEDETELFVPPSAATVADRRSTCKSSMATKTANLFSLSDTVGLHLFRSSVLGCTGWTLDLVGMLWNCWWKLETRIPTLLYTDRVVYAHGYSAAPNDKCQATMWDAIRMIQTSFLCEPTRISTRIVHYSTAMSGVDPAHYDGVGAFHSYPMKVHSVSENNALRVALAHVEDEVKQWRATVWPTIQKQVEHRTLSKGRYKHTELHQRRMAEIHQLLVFYQPGDISDERLRQVARILRWQTLSLFFAATRVQSSKWISYEEGWGSLAIQSPVHLFSPEEAYHLVLLGQELPVCVGPKDIVHFRNHCYWAHQFGCHLAVVFPVKGPKQYHLLVL